MSEFIFVWKGGVQLLSQPEETGRPQAGVELLCECLWFFTQLVHTPHVEGYLSILLLMGIFTDFKRFLDHPQIPLRGMCFKAVEAFAKASPEHRDMFIDYQYHEVIMKTVMAEASNGFQQGDLFDQAVLAIIELVRGEPKPEWTKTSTILPDLLTLIQGENCRAATSALKVLLFMTEISEEACKAVLTTGILPRLVKILEADINSNASMYVLKILLTTSNCGQEETQLIVEAGALPSLAKILSSDLDYFHEATCHILEEILRPGDIKAIRPLLDAKMIPALCSLITNAKEYHKIPPAHAILSIAAVAKSNPEFIDAMVAQGCIPVLLAVLSEENTHVKLFPIISLHILLKNCSERPMPYKDEVLDAAAKFKDHEDPDVAYEACQLAVMLENND